MNLTEARKIFEGRRPKADPELRSAMDAVIPILPSGGTRPPVGERLRQIRGLIHEARGFDPFGSRGRDWDSVTWRQCVWITLREEGYGPSEIGKASGYSHSTVYLGLSRLRALLACGDMLSVAIWGDYKVIIGRQS